MEGREEEGGRNEGQDVGGDWKVKRKQIVEGNAGFITSRKEVDFAYQ